MEEKIMKDLQDPEEANIDIEPYLNGKISNEENTLPKGVITNLIVNTIAQIGAKKYAEEERDSFIKNYTEFTTPWISALDFEGALGDIPVNKMSPGTRIGICITILIGGLFLIKPDKKEKGVE